MAVEGGFVGVPGFSVEVETQEDVYNCLDGMHTQAMDNFGETHEITNWLAAKMDEMRETFDLDEDVLYAP